MLNKRSELKHSDIIVMTGWVIQSAPHNRGRGELNQCEPQPAGVQGVIQRVA